MKEIFIGAPVIKMFAALSLAAVIGVWTAPSPAEAGIYDRVKDIFELPGEVDELKDEYNRVQEQYDASVKQLEEYRQAQQRLMEDNARLAEQNRQLTQTLTDLQHSEDARSRQSARWKRVGWTAAILFAGYFAATRLARFMWRARGQKSGG